MSLCYLPFRKNSMFFLGLSNQALLQIFFFFEEDLT